MEVRKEFVFRALQPGANISALCREFGVSRQNAYKWLRRFREQGAEGLKEQSRKPKSSGLSADAAVAVDAIRFKQEYGWGPKKIHELLLAVHGDDTPSVRTVSRILARAGMVKPRRKRRQLDRPTRAPVVPFEAPNDLWTVDFKGWWKTRDQARCEPLTVRDAASRFVLAVKLLPSGTAECVRDVFDSLFEQYGVPSAILSDNGSPFASTRALGGLSSLSAWWVSLGIKVHRGRPGCPQDNGGHERMHRDMRLEVQSHPAASPDEQQAVCSAWRTIFNEKRPHEALGMKTPASVYHKANRRKRARLVPSVPAQCELRRVGTYGRCKLRGRKFFVSSALRGFEVGFEEVEHLKFNVWFYDMLIGNFDFRVDSQVQPVSNEPGTNPEETQSSNQKGGPDTSPGLAAEV